jgi:hypothetical protein
VLAAVSAKKGDLVTREAPQWAEQWYWEQRLEVFVVVRMVLSGSE